MTLTSLEIVLSSAILSLVVGMLVHLATKNRYVCKSECDTRHRTLNSQISKLFTGMKLLIHYSKDVPDEEKIKMLSERGD